jgi:hypothetical protein
VTPEQSAAFAVDQSYRSPFALPVKVILVAKLALMLDGLIVMAVGDVVTVRMPFVCATESLLPPEAR